MSMASNSPHRDQALSDRPIRLLSYDEMINMPSPEWLIDEVIQQRSAVLMFGTSNSFKSFLAIDLALAVAANTSWHGNSVVQGKVLIVATEGANAVGRLRIPSRFDHYSVPDNARANVFLYPAEICLDIYEDVSELIDTMKQEGPFKLLVLDIFGGCMSGSEIDDKTARAWVHGVQRIIRETGATILAVAHTGWNNQDRARMHTHFWGSFDTRLLVEGDKGKMTAVITVERHKDADSSGTWGFRLEKSGSSLVPVLDESVQVSSSRKLTGQAQTALNALDDALKEHGERRQGENWPACKVVSVECWKAYCIRHSLSDSDSPESQRKAFNRAKSSLQNQGYIYVFDGYVWRCSNDETSGTDRDKRGTCPEMSRDREGGTDRDTPL